MTSISTYLQEETFIVAKQRLNKSNIKTTLEYCSITEDSFWRVNITIMILSMMLKFLLDW